jgi:hypothetical protein
MLAVPLDELDQIGREFGKVGQRFMDHHRLGSGGSRRRAPGRALGRDAFTLHQKDGLIVFTGQDGVIAFDEHDGWSIGAESEVCNINITLLETTYYTHNKPTGMRFSVKNPVRLGEHQSDGERVPFRAGEGNPGASPRFTGQDA